MPCRVALQTSEGSSFHAHWIIMTCQRNNSRPDDNAKNCPPSSSPGAPCIFQQRKAVPWALGSGHLKHQIIFLTMWLACLMKNENSQWENASSVSWYLCNPPGSHNTSIPRSQGCLWKWTINKCHPLFPTIKISLGCRHLQQHPQPLSHPQHTAWSLWEDFHCKRVEQNLRILRHASDSWCLDENSSREANLKSMLGIWMVKNQVPKCFRELLNGLQLCHISYYGKILPRDSSKVLFLLSGRCNKELVFSLLLSDLLKTGINCDMWWIGMATARHKRSCAPQHCAEKQVLLGKLFIGNSPADKQQGFTLCSRNDPRNGSYSYTGN